MQYIEIGCEPYLLSLNDRLGALVDGGPDGVVDGGSDGVVHGGVDGGFEVGVT